METSLPLFEQFKVHTDPHTAGVRWEKWITRLERLLEALDIIEKANDSADKKTAIDKRRLALLLHYAGPEVEDIYGTLTGNKDLDSTAKPLFATYFQPKKNVELEIFNFRNTTRIYRKHGRVRHTATPTGSTMWFHEHGPGNQATDHSRMHIEFFPKSVSQGQPDTGEDAGERARRRSSKSVCRKHRAERTTGDKRDEEFQKR